MLCEYQFQAVDWGDKLFSLNFLSLDLHASHVFIS